MLKKIAILLFILLIVQMVLYARLYANEFMRQAGTVGKTLTTSPANQPLERDIDAYLMNHGIETNVDEARLEEKYENVRIVTEPSNGNTTICFPNDNSTNFRLDIYDVADGLVASFANVKADRMEISKTIFNSGAYIYKLSGEANIYCGTFVLR